MNPVRPAILALLWLASQPGVQAADAVVWERVDAAAPGPPDPERTFYAIAWSGERYVAVGYGGHIETSTDGRRWEPTESGASVTLRDVVWAGIQFVAVGDYGTILTSPDGQTWTVRESNRFGHLMGVSFVEGRLFATVGSAILNSPDGVAWTVSDLPHFFPTANVIWIGDRFFAAGSGKVFFSRDGENWTLHPGSLDAITGCAWNGSRGLAYASDFILAETDEGWRVSELSMQSGGRAVRDIEAFNGEWIALVSTGSSSRSVFASTDGLSWTHRSSVDAASLIASDELLVAVGDGEIWASPDTLRWSPRLTESAASYLEGIWNGTRFVAVGASGATAYSNHGMTWTETQAPVEQSLGSVTWTGTQFVAVGTEGTILTSADGTTWGLQSSGTNDNLRSVAAAGNQLVIPLDDGSLLTSMDGVAWTREQTSVPFNLSCALWTGDDLLIGGRPGFLGRTADFKSWDVLHQAMVIVEQDRSAPSGVRTTPFGPVALAAGVGSVVAVGQGNRSMYSADGGNSWWPSFDANFAGEESVIWDGAAFVAVGRGSVVYASQDGRSWYPHDTGTGVHLHDVLFDGTSYLAVGDGGVILSSGDPLCLPDRTYADWAARQPFPPGEDGPGADPNRDGIPNLMAYALDVSALASLSDAERDGLPTVEEFGIGRIDFHYRRPVTGRIDLRYTLERSLTMEPGSWVERSRHDPGTGDWRIGSTHANVRLLGWLAQRDPQHFLRLRVELVPPER